MSSKRLGLSTDQKSERVWPWAQARRAKGQVRRITDFSQQVQLLSGLRHTSSSVEARTVTARRHGSTDERSARLRWPATEKARTGAVCTLLSRAKATMVAGVVTEGLFTVGVDGSCWTQVNYDDFSRLPL